MVASLKRYDLISAASWLIIAGEPRNDDDHWPWWGNPAARFLSKVYTGTPLRLITTCSSVPASRTARSVICRWLVTAGQCCEPPSLPTCLPLVSNAA
eukprot:3796399-Prymnesium_polylepis.1